MKYIAYGSNMVKEQMAYRCPGAKLIGTGYLPNHRLAFYLHATVERSSARDARVPVAVWEIDEADEQRLDRYEGFPNYYVKLRRRVILADGSEIEGMVYVMILIRRQPPTAEYYRAIRDAYRQLGFRDEIVRVLEPALRRSRERSGFQIRQVPSMRQARPPCEARACLAFVGPGRRGGGACPGWRLRANRAPTWAA